MNIFKLILFFIIIDINLPCTVAQSPLWYLTRGISGQSDEAWGVDADSAGCLYWAVEEKNQWPHWYYNIILYKIEPDAQQVWQSNSWGWTYNELAFIVKVHGNKLIIGGRIDSSASLNGTGGNALLLTAHANDGSFDWNYVYDQGVGYEEIDGIIPQPDGIYIAGWTQSPEKDTISGTMNMDFLIQKVDHSGQPIWSTIYDYDSLGRFDGENGHIAMDHNFIFAAAHVNRTNIATLDGQMALVCFNRSNGAYQWNVTWGGSSFDDGLGMTMSADSMLYIVGYTGSFGNGLQVFLNKYSRTGQLQWSRLWGGAGGDISRSVVADDDSIIYVVGTTPSYGNGGKDIFVLKYDSAGILLDSIIWGGSYHEVAHDAILSGDYLYITGTTESFGNGLSDGHKTDGLLIKINGRKMLAPDTISTLIKKNDIQNSVVCIYPNPFSDKAILHFTQPLSDADLIVYNTLGQEVKQYTGISGLALTIYRDRLKSGLYFFRLSQEKKIISTSYFMITDN
ncbi:MAG TPA: T9SS type A sorting domain-containing protein [Bacteroidales bacterium]|nr:T9SS type A sorting domain-containing protein [Bacteroidales bacterium]